MRTCSTASIASPSRRSSTRSGRCTGTRRRRRAATASTGRSRSRRSAPTIPALDAEVIQLYDALARAPRDHRLPARAELDRRPRLPSRLPRAPDRAGSTTTTPSSTTRRARSASTSPLRVFDTRSEARSVSQAPCRRRRRSASRSATPAGSTSPPSARSSTRTASRYELVPTLVRGPRLLHAHDLGVRRARRSGAQSTISRRRPLRLSGRGDRRPADARRRLRRRHRAALLALEEAGVEARPKAIDVFFVFDEGARPRRAFSPQMAELRARGPGAATPTTPAAR